MLRNSKEDNEFKLKRKKKEAELNLEEMLQSVSVKTVSLREGTQKKIYRNKLRNYYKLCPEDFVPSRKRVITIFNLLHFIIL